MSNTTAKASVREAQSHYGALFDAMDDAYCVIEMLFDQAGKPNDYRFLEVNSAFVRLTGWTQAVGVRMRELAPNHEEHWFEIYGKVALTGESIRFVQQANILDARWFDLYAFRLGGSESRSVAVHFSDITVRKHGEAALMAARTQLNEIIDLAPAFMAVFRGPLHSIEIANDAYFQLVGRRELIGLPIRDAFPEIEGQGFFELVERVYTTGESWVGKNVSVELRRQPDRPLEARWLDLVYQALRGEDGTVTGVFAHGVDITERKVAEEALVEAAAAAEKKSLLFDMTLSAMTEFGYTFDPDGRLLYVNKALLDLWGLRLDQALGKKFSELNYPVELAARLERQIQEVFDTGAAVGGDTLYTSPSGVSGHFEYILRPVLGDAGQVAQVAGSGRDITSRKRAEDELRDADRRKSEFLAMLAHELRNPLAPIRSGVQHLRAGDVDRESSQATLEMMERQISHMVRLIDDLLDVTRIERGTIELQRERVDLAPVLRQAVETVQPYIVMFEHEFALTLPATPIELNADTARLAQVFGNLLNNACKFTDRGGRIRLSVEPTADAQVVVRVEDNGVGIATEHLPHVFEMFAQIDSSLTHSRGGLGLGLTLVRNLVEMHGGSVEVFSGGVGHGSEFVVRLPMFSDVQAMPVASSVPQVVTVAPRRILVVDDNADAADTIALLLKRSGHEVHVANDGMDAVEMAETIQPDVVLLDLGLPRLDGYGVAREIRAQRGNSVLLIAVTGWAQADDVRRSSDAGFDAHMTKPLDYGALARRLAQQHVGTP